MATDPFHSFEADLKVSLKAAQTLASDYDRIRRSSGGNGGKKGSSSEEEETVFLRLQDSLETLENDIGDISESVQMIEARGPERFGVDSKELLRRKTFVRECENQLQVRTPKFDKIKIFNAFFLTNIHSLLYRDCLRFFNQPLRRIVKITETDKI